MWKFEHGEYVEFTAEELEAEKEIAKQQEQEQSQNPPNPTMEDRMVKVEQEVEDLSYVITGEVKTNAQ